MYFDNYCNFVLYTIISDSTEYYVMSAILYFHIYRTFQGGDLIIPKETQEILSNMSFGSTDIQPPGMFHYLPHLIGKADGLKPMLKLSKGRFGG